jgi:putative ABC transport system ATP-binding protein
MLVELAEVTKIYNRGAANEVVALHHINLRVAAGEMLCIQGPSGSGKTTLLAIIGCILAPTSGRAMLAGHKISRLPEQFRTRYRRDYVGFVFQNSLLLDQLTLLDNLTLPLLPSGLSPRLRAERADRLLARFGLGHRRNFPAAQLSGGELQRAALARALINDPPLLVADEPTAHLDDRLVETVLAQFRQLQREGKTVVLSSHDPRVTDHPAIDRLVSVAAGTIVADISKAG